MSTTQSGIKLARANLPEIVADPRKTPLCKSGKVPEWMRDPQVFEKDEYLIRLWRSETVDIEPGHRRLTALLETTKLEKTPKPTGLRWTYSKIRVGKFPYTMHGHFAGDQKCIDLIDLYRSITFEIRYVIERLAGREALWKRRRERRQRRKNRQ